MAWHVLPGRVAPLPTTPGPGSSGVTSSSQPASYFCEDLRQGLPLSSGRYPFCPVGNRGPRASKAKLQISKRSVGYVWGADAALWGKAAKMWQIKMRLGRGCVGTLRRTTPLSSSPSVNGSQFLGVHIVCLLPLKSSQGFSGKFFQSQGVGYIETWCLLATVVIYCLQGGTRQHHSLVCTGIPLAGASLLFPSPSSLSSCKGALRMPRRLSGPWEKGPKV